MAIARDASANAGKLTGAPASTTFALTMGSVSDGIMIFGLTFNRTDTTVTACAYNGVSATSLGSFSHATQGFGKVYLYYLVAPASGTHNVTASFGGTGDEAYPHAISYSGVDQSSPIDVTAGAQGSSISSLTITQTLSYAGSWFVAAWNSGRPASAGTNMFSVQSTFNQEFMGDSNGTVSTGSVGATATCTPADRIMGYCTVIKPVQSVAITETQLNRRDMRGVERGILRHHARFWNGVRKEQALCLPEMPPNTRALKSGILVPA